MACLTVPNVRWHSKINFPKVKYNKLNIWLGSGVSKKKQNGVTGNKKKKKVKVPKLKNKCQNKKASINHELGGAI